MPSSKDSRSVGMAVDGTCYAAGVGVARDIELFNGQV